jgi:hypothetical protein
MGVVYESGHFMAGNSAASGGGNASTAINTERMIYRGNNLGEVSISNIDTFMINHGISEGYFTDLCIGDYFTASYSGTTTTFRVMDIDPYYNISESGIAGKHHILIVPDQILTTSYMNSTKTSSTGYKGSYMFTTTIPSVNSNLKSIFGIYLLSHNEIVSTNDSTGTDTVSVTSILMNEIEVSGETKYSVASSGTISQLSGFKQNSSLKACGDRYWERDVGSGQYYFCYINENGYLDGGSTAPASASYGVRPRFLLG